MRWLLIAAHGSRVAESNREIEALAGRLSARSAGRFQQVTHAFLEIAAPSVETAIDTAVAAGASEIVVVPYFLAAGRHVTNDVPNIVRERSAAHRGVRITLATYLGADTRIPNLLLDLATDALRAWDQASGSADAGR